VSILSRTGQFLEVEEKILDREQSRRRSKTMTNHRINIFFFPFTLRETLALAGLLVGLLHALVSWGQPLPQSVGDSLHTTRPVRRWEFLSATGQRAAFVGNEAGRMEAWVYPLKLLRDLHLIFEVDGKALPADSLARSLTVRPESATILYAGDNFNVRETFFVPVQESGALIILEVDTEQPLEIEVAFHGDFQLEWPGSIGGTFMETAADGRGFAFGEESKHFAGLIGSPTAAQLHAAYQTNYSEASQSSFRLGSTVRGKETKLVVLAGSTEGREETEKTYQKLTSSYQDLLRESVSYYRDYLQRTVNLEIPDTQLQEAYDWARVSVLQGLVSNPDLGTGLIAGYRTSGESQRPGFAWFFGRDALWTSLALNSYGDTATTRTALSFVGKFQRDDGKIPHEISQVAGRVSWFKDFPYGYASADATPLYIIAMNDYLQESGDTAFIQEKWNNIWKAYQFLRSTWDEQGFPKNDGVGHGWVEGGPLLPVKTELYQTGLGAEALRALANLARATGQRESSDQLDQLFAQEKVRLNDSFWLTEQNRFAFALDQNNHPVDELSVLATVPMWFGMLDEGNANKTISQLARPDHQTDWGMRIISSASPKYSGQGYHFGSVWPLFTGWASVGEYRYHRAQPAYTNLRSNALLTLDGSLGHVTEVLSGTNYVPLSTSSPHQIWSAAMVVNPILRGLFGIEKNALTHTLTFAPHLPADWSTFTIRNIALSTSKLTLRYQKTPRDMTLEVTQNVAGNSVLNFEPALGLRAKVLGVELNGHPVEFHVAVYEVDQHVLVHVPLSTKTNTLRIRLKNDFGVTYHSTLPALGETSQGLRIISETWSPSRDTLTVNLEGTPGAVYDLAIWNGQQIRSVDRAKILEVPGHGTIARVQLAEQNDNSFTHSTITFHF
jgi:glycogen debranching enzyme